MDSTKILITIGTIVFSTLIGYNFKIVYDWLANRRNGNNKSKIEVVNKCRAPDSPCFKSTEFIKASESIKRMDRAMEELVKELIKQFSTTNSLLQQNKETNEKISDQLQNNNTTTLTLLDRVVHGGRSD